MTFNNYIWKVQTKNYISNGSISLEISKFSSIRKPQLKF